MKNKANKSFEPIKKSDKELYDLLNRKVLAGEYIFKKHSR
jgi:hypothetical protein